MIFLLYVVLMLDNFREAEGFFLVLAIVSVVIGLVIFCCNLNDSILRGTETETHMAGITKQARSWLAISRKLVRIGLVSSFIWVIAFVFTPSTRTGLILMGLSKIQQIGMSVDQQTGVYKKALKLLELKMDEALDKAGAPPEQTPQLPEQTGDK